MTQSEMQRKSLLNFIEWKMQHGANLTKEERATMRALKKLSYRALKAWAIKNDFIDGDLF